MWSWIVSEKIQYFVIAFSVVKVLEMTAPLEAKKTKTGNQFYKTFLF